METPRNLISSIGIKPVARAVGVTPSAVTNATARGELPASWYLAVKRLCDEMGLDCPPDFFGFRAASDTHNGDAA